MWVELDHPGPRLATARLLLYRAERRGSGGSSPDARWAGCAGPASTAREAVAAEFASDSYDMQFSVYPFAEVKSVKGPQPTGCDAHAAGHGEILRTAPDDHQHNTTNPPRPILPNLDVPTPFHQSPTPLKHGH